MDEMKDDVSAMRRLRVEDVVLCTASAHLMKVVLMVSMLSSCFNIGVEQCYLGHILCGGNFHVEYLCGCVEGYLVEVDGLDRSCAGSGFSLYPCDVISEGQGLLESYPQIVIISDYF